MRQITLRIDDELFEKIERARGQVPRERWLRRTIERQLTLRLMEPTSNFCRHHHRADLCPHCDKEAS
jgi:hypothetical protein